MVTGVAALAFGGFSALTAHRESTDDAQVEADVVPLSARAGGQVLKVLVHENSRVKVGDVVMELDEADQLARVRQAEAELATTQAQAVAAEAQVAVVEAGAKGGLQSARAFLSGSTVAVSSALANIVSARAGVVRAKSDQHKSSTDLKASRVAARQRRHHRGTAGQCARRP